MHMHYNQLISVHLWKEENGTVIQLFRSMDYFYFHCTEEKESKVEAASRTGITTSCS